MYGVGEEAFPKGSDVLDTQIHICPLCLPIGEVTCKLVGGVHVNEEDCTVTNGRSWGLA